MCPTHGWFDDKDKALIYHFGGQATKAMWEEMRSSYPQIETKLTGIEGIKASYIAR